MRFVLFFMLIPFVLPAQTRLEDRCSYSYVEQKLIEKGFAGNNTSFTSKQFKTTAASYTVPVVFHVILDKTQINKLGGSNGIREYINTQLAYLNSDFNAQNADSINIPAAFKPLFGNAGISFALAHTKYDGTASIGYEIVVTNKKGINIDGGIGSGTAFSNAKFSSTGGANAWDVSRYMNIWVVNMLEDNKTANYVGSTISPRDAKGNMLEPEMGIVLNYRTWEKEFVGRILTHEIGHYFSLVHTWGNNELCPGTGGEDDGITDTPPQAGPTFNICPAFPYYDGCTQAGNGIMFMNYMDYTDERCQNMFTKEQTIIMRADLAQNGISEDLAAHPELIEWPLLAKDNTFTIYPNPTSDKISIFFPASSDGMTEISITNSIGQLVNRIPVLKQEHEYRIDMSSLRKGVYFLQVRFTDKTIIKKVNLI